MTASPKMTFKRYGQAYHLRIETPADLRCAVELDESHWVATNAPVNTINCDSTFLQLLDTDDNARITCYELKQAARWLLEVLGDTSGVTAGDCTLRLDAINTDSKPGRGIHEAVRKMLAKLSKSEAGEITLQQVRQIKAQVASTPVSEAGVVLPAASQDPQIGQFIADVIAATGGAAHPSGTAGLGKDQLDQFASQAGAYLNWHERGQIAAGADSTDIMSLGDRTPAAYDALVAIRGKIDQYFAQCEALALDERFAARMGWTEAELADLDFDDPEVIERVLAQAPLGRARADRVLHLDEQVNPFYTEALSRFREQVLAPVLGKPSSILTAADWQEIRSVFGPYRAWVEAEPAGDVGALGVQKLRRYLDDRYTSAVAAVIDESAATAFELGSIRLVEKLILYQRYMIELANNFVSFPHLYDPAKRAMFEMGTLVMDGRRFNLSVRVDDRAKHIEIAKTSNMYLLYVQVAPPHDAPKFEVAVPVTSRGKGNLCVGKRGIFTDTTGAECDATVASIIENPISLCEALVSPFVRFGKLVTGKIESITARAEKKLDASASAAMTQAATAPAATRATSPLATGGMLMGAGVAVAALGSALAYITKTLAQTHWLAIVIGVLAAILLVMLPTLIVASLKLRRRDLSAILEGSGWAINARMRLTTKQGRFFTERPRYPARASGIFRLPWRWVVAVVLIVLGTWAVAWRIRQSRWETHIPADQPTTQQAGGATRPADK